MDGGSPNWLSCVLFHVEATVHLWVGNVTPTSNKSLQSNILIGLAIHQRFTLKKKKSAIFFKVNTDFNKTFSLL